MCPAYWMVEAFTDKGRNAYKYQYSVPPATHGSDVSAYFGPPSVVQSPEFEKAFASESIFFEYLLTGLVSDTFP